MTWSDYKTWLHDRLENPIHREWTAVMKLEDLQQNPSLPSLRFLMILEFRLLLISETMNEGTEIPYIATAMNPIAGTD